jgi:prepilin-type processing-associated H-X9-DG protein
MNNLRQLGLATQMYLNDNDGVLFDATTSWMGQLHPKYLGAWKTFQSPFDQRSPSETDTTARISYGLNGNTKVGSSIAGLMMDKVKSASTFIVFAPAQDGGSTVRFSGLPGTNVTVYKAGAATGGTHGSRKRINAVFADWHSESMTWTTFINDVSTPADPSASLRWDPYTPYP